MEILGFRRIYLFWGDIHIARILPLNLDENAVSFVILDEEWLLLDFAKFLILNARMGFEPKHYLCSPRF
jgi:hypothetical protein